MTGFGVMFLLVAMVSVYALGLVGYRLLLSAKRLNIELIKSKALIEDLNSFEMTIPSKAEANTGAELLSLLGERRKIGQAKEQRVKARRRRLVQRINDIEIDKR
jgi:type III secretion system FlhB-like substrate exporter